MVLPHLPYDRSSTRLVRRENINYSKRQHANYLY